MGSYAHIQACMVAPVARIRGNRLQVVAAQLPENLSCVKICVLRDSPDLLVIENKALWKLVSGLFGRVRRLSRLVA